MDHSLCIYSYQPCLKYSRLLLPGTARIFCEGVASSWVGLPEIGMTTRQTTANHRKPPQITANHHSCAGKKQVPVVCLSHGSFKVASRICGARCFREYPSVQILHIYDVSVVVCGDLLGLALYRQTTTNHYRNAVNNTKFGMMCICVPVKSMPRLFCVMYRFQGDIYRL